MVHTCKMLPGGNKPLFLLLHNPGIILNIFIYRRSGNFLCKKMHIKMFVALNFLWFVPSVKFVMVDGCNVDECLEHS